MEAEKRPLKECSVLGRWSRTPSSCLSALPITKASKGRNSMLESGDPGSGHSFVTTMGSLEIFNHLD